MQSTRITDIPGLMHLWKLDNLYLAGQPSPESLQSLKELGIKKVFNLRNEAEADFSWEEKSLEDLGIDYEQFPIVTEQGLDAKNCERLSKQLNEKEPFFIHCGSANRVGGWLVTYLVKHRGMDFEEAVDTAMNSGLANPAFADQALRIIEESK